MAPNPTPLPSMAVPDFETNEKKKKTDFLEIEKRLLTMGTEKKKNDREEKIRRQKVQTLQKKHTHKTKKDTRKTIKPK